MFIDMDTNGDGAISFEEFCEAVGSPRSSGKVDAPAAEPQVIVRLKPDVGAHVEGTPSQISDPLRYINPLGPAAQESDYQSSPVDGRLDSLTAGEQMLRRSNEELSEEELEPDNMFVATKQDEAEPDPLKTSEEAVVFEAEYRKLMRARIGATHRRRNSWQWNPNDVDIRNC
eukprot:TRINITY_DN1176_c0_g1_i2.p1 TRINITY_DN1176_c0_g1~~TRINITY_DN1176_c0_g1_i2.p1  ORF type:complete len:172 (+),score=20.85 TRINITY_DN1176_c0_g1_i2:472-987(+)